MPATISNHKALDIYDAAMAAYAQHDIAHEQATRLAFSTLLDTLSKSYGWTLVLEQALHNRSRPDGTLLDEVKFPRGYWEAKDTNDDLEAEIQAKTKRGYPLTNIIFEDTRRAVLFQDGRRVFEADMRQRVQLVTLLELFFGYTGAKIEEFNAAVAQFRERIPELARSVEQIIEEQRTRNQRFIKAFDAFHEICRQGIDPNISADTIEKMLVQHLLTERLFRTVFDDPDFTRRNVIANEIENVIKSLTWNRSAFLQQLDPFYLAIEDAARTIRDFAQKQTFLNTVYERFFQGFSKNQADTHGVVYTPQPIVDFMVASVDEVLQREFGVSLSTPGVKVLDPATGTGNFIVNILRRLNRRDLKQKYREDLFANEIMLLPYYIASLNIEHAYYDLTGDYEPFEGLCFADTLDLAESQQMSMFAEENTERVERQKKAEITVIIGNPPYNVGQVNENDNNKNRRYAEIDKRVRETYSKASSATNRNALDDMYVKFFRWAVDRLRGRDGIVCFVSNNSFVDQLAFDGMRQHLLRDFTDIYHIDLHGNVRKNPKLSGTTHNVFGIQVGVGITIAVRNAKHTQSTLHYVRVPEDWTSVQKLEWLAQQQRSGNVEWRELTPNARNVWLTEGMQDDFDAFVPVGSKETRAEQNANVEAIFKTYSNGLKANRDTWVYAFDANTLAARMQGFVEFYNAEVDRWQRRSDRNANVDDFVNSDDTKIKWSRDLKVDLQRGRHAQFAQEKIRHAFYRPFCRQFVFLDRILNEEVYQQPQFFPTPASETENVAVVISDVAHRSTFSALVTNSIPDLHLLAAIDAFQCFPFYVYNEDGSERRENITDWALAQFQERYQGVGAGEQGSGVSGDANSKLKTENSKLISKWDIFHYVYAVLHHPHYRERYAENLKRELPRIPFVDAEAFPAFVEAGRRLAELHLNYEHAPEYRLTWHENRDIPFSWRVSKMKLSRDKTQLIVNPSLTLSGIPPEAFQYRLGNRSALEWVIDQYQVSTDKRSGITSDPNRAGDEEYIVRLVGRVVTVSVETVKIVNALPAMGNVE